MIFQTVLAFNLLGDGLRDGAPTPTPLIDAFRISLTGSLPTDASRLPAAPNACHPADDACRGATIR